jgi:hypothetical protein
MKNPRETEKSKIMNTFRKPSMGLSTTHISYIAAVNDELAVRNPLATNPLDPGLLTYPPTVCGTGHAGAGNGEAGEEAACSTAAAACSSISAAWTMRLSSSSQGGGGSSAVRTALSWASRDRSL